MCFCSYCATLQGVEEPGLGEPTCEIKGVLLAAAALGANETAWSGLAEADREACLAAWRWLGDLGSAVQKSVLARWRAQVTAGIPDGIERLHPSWLDFVLAGEPPDVVAQVREMLPRAEANTGCLIPPGVAARASVPLAVVKMALEPLQRLYGEPCGPLAAELVALPFDELAQEVIRTGAHTLAWSLAGSEASVQARAMAMAGEPWAAIMANALREPVSPDARKAALAHVAANVESSARSPAERLAYVGLAALRARLVAEHPSSPYRVAGRLPAALGRRLVEW
jgi:hypothetical protein